MSLKSLFLYQVSTVVDEGFLQQLFEGHVEKCTFGGFGLGRFALVDFDDAAYRNMVLSQSIGGILLEKAVDVKAMTKALKRNKHHTIDPSKAKKQQSSSSAAPSSDAQDEMALVDFVASKIVRDQEEAEVRDIANIVSSTVLASLKSGLIASPNAKKGSFVHPSGGSIGETLQNDNNVTISSTLLRMIPAEKDRATLIPTLGRFSSVVVGKCRLGITGSETSVAFLEDIYKGGLLGCKFCDGTGFEEDGTTPVVAIDMNNKKGILSSVFGGTAAQRETVLRENGNAKSEYNPKAKQFTVKVGLKRDREEDAAVVGDANAHHITFEAPVAKVEQEPSSPIVKTEKVSTPKKATGPVDFSSDDDDEDSLFKANNVEHNPRYTTNSGATVTKATKGAPVSTAVKVAPVVASPRAPVEAAVPALNNRQRKQQAKAEGGGSGKATKLDLKFEDSDDE